MRIGIDFHAAERTGTGNGTYIRNLVEALLRIGGDHEYFLYVTDPSFPYYKKFAGLYPVRLRPLALKNPLARLPLLGAYTWADRLDLLHVQYVAPPFHRGRLVVTVHDISFRHFPQYFRTTEWLYLSALTPLSLKKAGHIITISEHSRRDILRHYPVSPNKIHTTALASGPLMKPVDDVPEAKSVVMSYGVQPPYILYVGRLDARKNISALIRAYVNLKKNKHIPHTLVLVGKKAFGPDPRLLHGTPPGSSSPDILSLGYVPCEHLPFYYHLAEVLVSPSLFEGFGLPLVEAMACGCPVVASNVASHPEILGAAGRLFNPEDDTELADALYQVLTDQALREKMRQEGLQRARAFSWEKTARKTLDIYALQPSA